MIAAGVSANAQTVVASGFVGNPLATQGSSLPTLISTPVASRSNPFNALGNAVFNALHLEPTINYIETPIDIRDKYQYFTQANMQKLCSIGYNKPFTSLEEGVHDYVTKYLMKNICY